MRRVLRVLTLVFLLGLLSPGLAIADTIVATFVSVAPNGSGGFTWTYSATLSSGFALDPAKTWTSTPDGQFFTIYDFGGFTGVTTEPAAWTPSSANTGVTPAGTVPADDPSLPNITWTYSGAFVGSATSSVALGTFTVDSLYGGMTVDAVSSQDTVFGSPSIRNTSVNSTTVALVPEPSSLLLMGVGLVALALRRRWR